MDETTYNETRDELCLFLNECKIEKIISGSLAKLMKSLELPYYNVIPSILREQNIMILHHEGRQTVWEWTSKVDPSRNMANKILETAKEKTHWKREKTENSKPGRKPPLHHIVNKVFILRSEGKSLEEIGSIVGKDKSTICKWLKNYKKVEINVPKYSLTTKPRSFIASLEKQAECLYNNYQAYLKKFKTVEKELKELDNMLYTLQEKRNKVDELIALYKDIDSLYEEKLKEITEAEEEEETNV